MAKNDETKKETISGALCRIAEQIGAIILLKNRRRRLSGHASEVSSGARVQFL